MAEEVENMEQTLRSDAARPGTKAGRESKDGMGGDEMPHESRRGDAEANESEANEAEAKESEAKEADANEAEANEAGASEARGSHAANNESAANAEKRKDGGIASKESSGGETRERKEEESADKRFIEACSKEAKKSSSSTSSRRSTAGVPYRIPDWSDVPTVEFHLEVLKGGSVIHDMDISKKGAYMFGRLPLCDFVLEHPSISRFHAVIQFGENNSALLMDLKSAHGTFINKRQVKAETYVPLRVGDIIRFGQSSRLYVFQGPTELMPEEALSKEERRALRQMASQDAAERSQREAVLSGRGRLVGGRKGAVEGGEDEEDGGATWGFQEDAEEELMPDVDEDELTWQKFKGELTDHQCKIREKLQKRLEKVGHMQREMDAIEAKEVAQGGLTQGQQTQIARNQQRMQQLMEEAESLEETLNESIRESVCAKSGGKAGSRGRTGREEDEEDQDDSDDDFYDRSRKLKGSKGKSKGGGQGGGGGGGGGKEPVVETAASLMLKQYELQERLEAMEKEAEEEERRVEEERRGKRETDGGVKGIGMGESVEGREGAAECSLDEFMSQVVSQIDEDRLRILRREHGRVKENLERVRALLRIADPMGEAALGWAPPKGRAKGSFAAWAAALGAKNKEGADVIGAIKKEGAAVLVAKKREGANADAEKLNGVNVDKDNLKTVVAIQRKGETPEGERESSVNREDASVEGTKSLKERAVDASAKLPSRHEGGYVVHGKGRSVSDGSREGVEGQPEEGLRSSKEGPLGVAMPIEAREPQDASIRKGGIEVEEGREHQHASIQRDGIEVDEERTRAAEDPGRKDSKEGVSPKEHISVDVERSKGSMAPPNDRGQAAADADVGDLVSGEGRKRVSRESVGKDVKKLRRVLGPARPPGMLTAGEEESDVWVPPQGQSGDGKTSLNERLGY